jgi:hypothetical protein
VLSREEIELSLKDEVLRTRKTYELASKEFKNFAWDAPSGLPHPDGGARVKISGNAYYSAMTAYALALREFNQFLVEGVIPDRLQTEPVPELKP